MAEEVHQDHGSSPAAWTAVILLLVASVSVAIGVAWGLHFFYYLGAALAIVGVLAGKVMGAAGLGNKNKLQAPPLPADAEAHTSESQAS